MGGWTALVAAIVMFGLTTPARGTDFFWVGAGNGSFVDPARWTPFSIVPPIIGPGGAGDTVNFDVGVLPGSRYTVASVAGQNNRLLVHNDSLTLALSGNYTLLDTSASDPSFTVGVAAGDTGDVMLIGTGTLQTEYVSVGHAADSIGVVTVELDWDANGDLLIGDFGAGYMTIQNGGSVSNTDGIIANTEGSTGEMVVTGDGSTWTNSGRISVGLVGNGTLRVEDGGTVESGMTESRIGAAGNAIGTVTVTGDGSAWNLGGNLLVGVVGTGMMMIDSGGNVSNADATLGQLPNSNGTVAVRDAGSTWTVNGNLVVGSSGTGALTVANSGTLEVVGGSFRLGFSSGSAGTLNVGEGGAAGIVDAPAVTSGDGLARVNFDHVDVDYYFTDDGTAGGAPVLIAGSTSVNHLGKGTTMLLGNHTYTGTTTVRDGLLVVDGGSIGAAGADVTVGQLATNNGRLTVTGGGSLASAAGTLGDANGAAGTVTVNGPGSTWTASGDLAVGRFGNGTLRIQGGGTVQNAFGRLGSDSLASGMAVVTGADSTWTNTGNLEVGVSGEGDLMILAAADVTNASGRIAVNSGSIGTVTVDGDDSTWTNSSRTEVGVSGEGTLNIQNGAVVFSNSLNTRIGVNAGSIGEATVDGEDSTWQNAQAMEVGFSGSGLLTIQNGGTVSSSRGVIGVNNMGTGNVLVSGDGSTWTNANDVEIGRDSGSAGRLTIEAGGSVSNTFAVIGSTSGSTGTVIVTGEGSLWNNSFSLDVGVSGVGSLTISDSGEVVVASTLRANAASQILLDGGKLTVDQFGPGGLDALDWQSGTLRLTTAGGLAMGAGGLFGPSLLLSANQILEVDEALAIDGGATLFAGGGLSTGSTDVAPAGQLFLGATSSHGTGLANGGHVVVTQPASVDGPVANAAGGAITALEDVTFNDQVSGPGGFFGPGAITFAGGFSPGASPAGVGFEGDVVLSATNTLTIELGGTELGTEHDALTIDGTATLGGTLDVSLIDPAGGANDFTPAAGDEFQIITAAGGIDGTFADAMLPSLGGVLAWNVNYGANTVLLSVGLAGDYNQNGVVDAADYTVWRDNLGGLTALPNDDTPGVGPDDYTRWKNNFGMTAGSGAGVGSNAAVPEPPAVVLVFVAGLITSMSGLRRNSK